MRKDRLGRSKRCSVRYYLLMTSRLPLATPSNASRSRPSSLTAGSYPSKTRLLLRQEPFRPHFCLLSCHLNCRSRMKRDIYHATNSIDSTSGRTSQLPVQRTSDLARRHTSSANSDSPFQAFINQQFPLFTIQFWTGIMEHPRLIIFSPTFVDGNSLSRFHCVQCCR